MSKHKNRHKIHASTPETNEKSAAVEHRAPTPEPVEHVAPTPQHGEKMPLLEKKWRHNPDWWMVIFSFLLAVFAAGSFVELWIQLNDARSAFVKSQRPYVWITIPTDKDKHPTPILEPNKKGRWDVFYENFGQSPANGVVEKGLLLFDQNAMLAPHERFFAQTLHKSPTDPQGSVLPPGERSGEPLKYTSVYTNKELTADDISFIKGHEGALVVWIRFEYFDNAGNMYHSNVCEYLSTTGAIADCPWENTMD